MTLHKLSAGTGYEYLICQVAALDSTEKGTTPLSDYYAAKGEAPGRWVGSGLAGLDGIVSGDVVTAEQMEHLFGTGSDPLTGQPLKSPYKLYGTDGVDGFNVEVGLRLGKNQSARSEPGCARRWRGSSSSPTTAVSRGMLGNSRLRWLATRGPARPRSRAST
jgi:hypothetical protein